MPVPVPVPAAVELLKLPKLPVPAAVVAGVVEDFPNPKLVLPIAEEEEEDVPNEGVAAGVDGVVPKVKVIFHYNHHQVCLWDTHDEMYVDSILFYFLTAGAMRRALDNL